MSPAPPTLSELLFPSSDVERARAWRRFVDEHTRLLLHVAHSLYSDRDDAMDAYAYMLEQLAAGDYRQLRRYADDGRSKFSTWLVVVARRMCLDHYRKRYGRRREGESGDAQHVRNFRRRLQRAASDDTEAENVPEPSSGAEVCVRQQELYAVLDGVLATLSSEDRLILQLRYEQELSAQQIAHLVDLPSPFHVYRRLTSLTEQLRTALIARGVEDAAP